MGYMWQILGSLGYCRKKSVRESVWAVIFRYGKKNMFVNSLICINWSNYSWILLFFNWVLLNLVFISSEVATRWETWGSWLECRTQDDTVAKCWKDVRDPPQQRRRRFCVKEGLGTGQLCNEEKRSVICIKFHTWSNFDGASVWHNTVKSVF